MTGLTSSAVQAVGNHPIPNGSRPGGYAALMGAFTLKVAEERTNLGSARRHFRKLEHFRTSDLRAPARGLTGARCERPLLGRKSVAMSDPSATLGKSGCRTRPNGKNRPKSDLYRGVLPGLAPICAKRFTSIPTSPG